MFEKLKMADKRELLRNVKVRLGYVLKSILNNNFIVSTTR